MAWGSSTLSLMTTLAFLRSCEPNDICVEFELRDFNNNSVCVMTKDDQTVLLNTTCEYIVVNSLQTYCDNNNISTMTLNFVS